MSVGLLRVAENFVLREGRKIKKEIREICKALLQPK
jgi:hypothetical protein